MPSNLNFKISANYLPLSDAPDSSSEESSLIAKEMEIPMLPKHRNKTSFTTRELALMFLLCVSTILCAISIALIIQTNTFKARLDEYSATLIDTTNRKWGYGEDLIPGGFDVSPINSTNAPPASPEKLPPFRGNGVEGNPAFPASIDIVDNRKPNEVITKDWNVVVTSHVRFHSPFSFPF